MRKITIFILIFTIFVVNLHFLECKTGFALTETSAEGMVVIESSSGRILNSKNENKKLPMASTTKILTAIVAIENCSDLDTKHKIPKQAVGIEGSSIYLKEGEMLSIRELLYGLMLRSGNDSAVAIALVVAGSVEDFVKLMNEKCKNLGLSSTNIVTVNGLHDDNHYTTALELAKITAYALSNQVFADIVSTRQTSISNDKGKDDKRFLRNKNRFLNMLEFADGVKTGYTKKAGRCFVGSATKNGMKLICVVLNCIPMFEDCKNLILEAFEKYSMVKLFSKGEIININHKNIKTQKIPILIKNDIIYPLNKEEVVKTTAKLEINEDLKLPLNKNVSIGRIDIMLENNLIFSEKAYTIDIEENVTVKDNFHKIIKAF